MISNNFSGRYDEKKTKFFLARILVEVDVTNRPDFDELQAADYFSSVFSLTGNDRKREVTVQELRPKASSITDVDSEEYEYRGFVITICQNADTVGTAVPTYHAVVAKPNSKSGRVMWDHSHDRRVVVAQPTCPFITRRKLFGTTRRQATRAKIES